MTGGNRKIIVAMSGGVDSSVAAAVLKGRGHLVSGVYLRLWKEEALADRSLLDARRVADRLGIRLKVIDARKKFRESVVEYFLEEYRAGRTPNPCVFCNENLKFKIILEEMGKSGADMIATGHYALAREVKVKSQKFKDKNEYKLFQAIDREKDQSYFLYRLKQSQLARIFFPLGEYTKAEVRKMAGEFGLPVHEKKESQDVCFICGETADFIRRKLRPEPGNIVDQTGETIGRHLGLPLYTIGQRRGMNVGGRGPYFVTGKDAKKDILRVSNVEADLYAGGMEIRSTSWIAGEPELPCRALVKTRYREKAAYAIIKSKKRGVLQVFFDEPHRAITTGQSAVFYREDGEVIGGGIIK